MFFWVSATATVPRDRTPLLPNFGGSPTYSYTFQCRMTRFGVLTHIGRDIFLRVRRCISYWTNTVQCTICQQKVFLVVFSGTFSISIFLRM